MTKGNFDFLLCLDSGNTRDKIALYNRQLQTVAVGVDNLSELISHWELSPANTVCALASSRERSGERPELREFELYNIREERRDGRLLNMPIFYSQGLGADRLALAYGAYDGKDAKALVDCGTFTTVDLVDSNGFQGGVILPGLGQLIRSYQDGALLKDEAPSGLAYSDRPPQDSAAAMASGLWHAAIAPIKEILKSYGTKTIYVTGGNGDTVAQGLEKALAQRSASIHFDSQLVNKGLLRFLTALKSRAKDSV